MTVKTHLVYRPNILPPFYLRGTATVKDSRGEEKRCRELFRLKPGARRWSIRARNRRDEDDEADAGVDQ